MAFHLVSPQNKAFSRLHRKWWEGTFGLRSVLFISFTHIPSSLLELLITGSQSSVTFLQLISQWCLYLLCTHTFYSAWFHFPEKVLCPHAPISLTQVHETWASYFGTCCMAWKPGNSCCYDFYVKWNILFFRNHISSFCSSHFKNCHCKLSFEL